MKLKVEHLTEFEYNAPIYETTTEVRLQPISNHGGPQLCENFVLEVEPATNIYTYEDYYGNHVHHFSLLQSHSKLTINTVSLVRTGTGPTPATEHELLSMYDFQAPSSYVLFSPAAIQYAARFPREQAETEPSTLALKVCQAINEEFQYQKGVTDVYSTVDRVLELKSGVCQDFAHVMITICRVLGLPARYVSGYLYGGNSQEDQEGATHAWCEVYCGPDVGWAAFDPTHRSLTINERYIKIGTGRDYSDVAPVRGTFKGNARESLKVSVKVTAAE